MGPVSIKLVIFTILFAFTIDLISAGQGYSGINDVNEQAQPSNSGNQNFDAAEAAPSFEDSESSRSPYKEQRCAAEYPTERSSQTEVQLISDQTSTLASASSNPETEPAGEPRSETVSTIASPASTEASSITDGTTQEPDPEADPRIDIRAQTPSKPLNDAETTTELGESAEPRSADLDNDRIPSDSNQLKEAVPSAMSTDALIQLISELNRKLKDLEETQRALNKNVEDLHEQLQNFSQALPVKKQETAKDLVSGQPREALEKWKDLEANIDSVQDLKNVTNDIVTDALDQAAPPAAVMDFVHELPNKEVQNTAYNTVADKMADSEPIQEKMGWKEMTPYCRNAAMDTGRNSPTTMKMFNLQNQMRLNGAKPVAQGSMFIQNKRFQPAANVWMNMVQDIPESPAQLETNMKKMMIRTYDKNPFNLPNAFQFILVLPENQGTFKRVAYNCLLQEMAANGHSYNPSNTLNPNQQQRPMQQFQPQQQRFQPQQQQQQPRFQPQQPQQQRFQPQQQFRPSVPQLQPNAEVYRYY